ncbi:MAG TPA: alpha/beta hydrolase [Chitinophagaceae bacterium]|nr:alpha/beta hydrolase [Chitinophagaceae bacterium]
MTSDSQRLVVFITGTFIGNNCWDDWKTYFESQGYKCISPAWPHKDATPEELRNRPSNDPIASNTLTDITNHFASIINSVPERPILIGHSLGGLIVQLLLQKGLGVAGVAIHSFPPKGVNRFWLSFLKAIWETMVLFSSSKHIYLMSFNKWRYTIANGMDYEQQKELYYRYAIPESKKIIREAFNCIAKVDYNKPHPPLLITSGSNDKLIPASLNYSNYKKYANGNSVTEYIEFKAHTHLVFGVPAWKEEAGAALNWLQELKQNL